MIFTIKDDVDSNQTTVFDAKIDADSDFLVKADGVNLFFIDKDSGELNRFYVNSEGQTQVPGIKFEENFIKVTV